MAKKIDLGILKNRREDLLRAEAAAWLHDMGKCADAFLREGGMGFNADRCKDKPRVNPHKAILSPKDLETLPYWEKMSPERGQCSRKEETNHETALWKTLNKLGVFPSLFHSQIDLGLAGKINFRELILWGRPLVCEQYENFSKILEDRTYLAALLGYAHKIAHLEKENEADGKSLFYTSSPFGFSDKCYAGKLDEKLKAVLEKCDKQRKEFISQVAISFKEAPGDTKCPINEVSLWDWSSIVTALYKAELARSLLIEQRSFSEVKWRLLSIRLNGLEYLLDVFRIPDLKARRELLQDALNRIRDLLEEEYPLGCEVYRDENGSLFVVPDIENLDMVLFDSDKQKMLRELILANFAKGTLHSDYNLNLSIHGEVVPEIYVDEEEWTGYVPEGLPPVNKHLQRVTSIQSDAAVVTNWWRNQDGEICIVCGLRPQGPSPKAKECNICDVCERRRTDRSKEWVLKKLHTTIWIDEVADTNGRVALLVGQFDLIHWLSGDLVRTLAVRNPANAGNKTADEVAKNPSFARLRRIWETTRRFWQEVLPTDENVDLTNSLVASVLGKADLRLEIKPKNADQLELGPYHAYELVLSRGVKVSVVWDAGNRRFIIAENLDYISKPEQLDENLKQWLERHKEAKLILEEPVGYGSKNKIWGEIEIEDVEEIPDSAYIPAIPILAEPRTFMALVPADRALEVVKAIKTKYEREMGKVRNRLPLHLGIVYANRRMPLRAVLDAGRQMLERKDLGELTRWRVENDVNESTDPLPSEVQALAQGTQQFDRWYPVRLRHETTGRTLTWYVPAVMGDGTTKDHWYPYVFLETLSAPVDRMCYFQAPNPWTGSKGWLVHVGELKKEDIIYFTPSTLDFQWLDTNARRFTIACDDQGRRRDLPHRPYLLDEIETLDYVWDTLKNHLSKNQIYILRDLIETKREEWQAAPDNKIFRQFCHDALANAEWKKGKDGKRKDKMPWGAEGKGKEEKEKKEKWLQEWTDYAVRGWLTDVVELYLQIMKKEA